MPFLWEVRQWKEPVCEGKLRPVGSLSSAFPFAQVSQNQLGHLNMENAGPGRFSGLGISCG